jgi:hypothetical protein
MWRDVLTFARTCKNVTFNRTLRTALIAVVLAPALSAANPQPKWQCASYQKCDEAGTRALRTGDVDRAIGLFELQAGYAELADIELGHTIVGEGKEPAYPLGTLAYNNLAVANMQKGDYLKARLWCQQALKWDRDNKAAQLNLRRVNEKLKDWKWPTSVSGLYLRYAGRGKWETFCVKQTGDSSIVVTYFGMRMGLYPEGTPASLGDFQATLELHNQNSTYLGEPDFPCKVRMSFALDKVGLEQSGDCGFGYGVEATGDFERASTSAECP